MTNVTRKEECPRIPETKCNVNGPEFLHASLIESNLCIAFFTDDFFWVYYIFVR